MDRWAAVDNISAEKIILCALLNKIISWMDSGSLALSLVVYVCVLTFTIVLKRTFDEQFLRCQRKVSDAFSMISKKQSCQTQIEFIILRFRIFMRWCQIDFEQARFSWPLCNHRTELFWIVRNEFRCKIFEIDLSTRRTFNVTFLQILTQMLFYRSKRTNCVLISLS